MITSSNGNIFRVTGPFWVEFTGHRTKASDAELWCFLWSAPNERLSKHGETGDLRRHRAHYDVMIMWSLMIGYSLNYNCYEVQLLCCLLHHTGSTIVNKNPGDLLNTANPEMSGILLIRSTIIIYNSWHFSIVKHEHLIRFNQSDLVTPLITRFMGPTWDPSEADRTQVGPMNFAIWDVIPKR